MQNDYSNGSQKPDSNFPTPEQDQQAETDRAIQIDNDVDTGPSGATVSQEDIRIDEDVQ